MFLTDYEIGNLVKKKLHFVDNCFELPNFHSFTDMIKALNSIPATDNFYFIFFPKNDNKILFSPFLLGYLS